MTRTFNVTDSFTISEVEIGVHLTHTYRSDLVITLTRPGGGTSVILMNRTGGAGDNLHDYFDDDAASAITSHSSSATDSTATPPPYSHSFRPSAVLSAFDGGNSSGIWTLQICDQANVDVGTFIRADLYLTSLPPNYADLSLTKSVSNATPANGATITYTLAVTNAGTSTNAATGVEVTDTLPPGVIYVSATGDGSYSSSTGIWTVGSLNIGQTKTIVLTVTVNATAGATVTNGAEVRASSWPDIDSTVNNGSTTEDDDAFVSFTVAGTRTAGTPPTLTCPVGSTSIDWDSVAWPDGDLNENVSVASIGTVNVAISLDSPASWVNDAAYGGANPATHNTVTGGLSPAQMALNQYIDFTTQSQVSTTVITLPGAIPGAQFRIFDVDYAVNDFADKITVTGSNGGSSVTPTLTNGISNYVVGNTAIGDAGAANDTANGTVVVTFSSPVDTITITYGNHTTAPANPDGQVIALHDITFCNPLANVTMAKFAQVYDNGVDPAFFTPGNDALYSIQVGNTGLGQITSNSIFILDPMPSTMTFFNGDADGTGPGTTPVLFTDSGSGLTFTYASDVRFSNSVAAPANFAACTYTPTAGYDANVRHVCVNPKGVMNGKTGAATPSFTIRFRTRIQ